MAIESENCKSDISLPVKLPAEIALLGDAVNPSCSPQPRCPSSSDRGEEPYQLSALLWRERVNLSHLHPNTASVRVLSTGGGFVCAGVRISLDTCSEERMESTSLNREPRLSPCLVRDGQGS